MAISFAAKTSVIAISHPAKSSLLLYEAACKAVSEARTADEAIKLAHDGEALRLLGKAAKNRQIEVDGAEIRIRAERRLGQIMDAQREAGLLSAGGRPGETGSRSDPVLQTPAPNAKSKPVPPGPKITLMEAGIDKHLADRARKGAAMSEITFEDKLSDNRRAAETGGPVTVAIDAKKARRTREADEAEWHTPDEYIGLVSLVLGRIELDPASTPIANITVQAAKFFTKLDDGLGQEWAGRVYLNPPDTKSVTALFVDKLITEWTAARINSAIVLTHNQSDTVWFHKLIQTATAMCITSDRVRQVSPEGGRSTPKQGQVFFYFGPDIQVFANVFEAIGTIVKCL